MSSHAPRPASPCALRKLSESDLLARKAAWTVASAGTLADVARATKRHPSGPSRERGGIKGGIPYRAHLYVAQLARCTTTDPVPFVMSLMVEALKTELRKWGTRELVKEWHALYDRTPFEGAQEESASRGSDWDEFCRAHLTEAATQERLVAVTEILVHERKENPREWRGDGIRQRNA